eukprot:Lithocolla_globosa_v1_NODE_793_length_3272_cov_24.216661.p3 type:complete len:140 gc:universal NODE_793_length_3272_cov_24.216661:1843-1424(-)
MPVFPEVGSIMVVPGFKTPLRSASSTMRLAMRSLTEPPALKNSHFANTSHFKPSARGILLRRTIGVLPMASSTVPMTAGRGVTGMTLCGEFLAFGAHVHLEAPSSDLEPSSLIFLAAGGIFFLTCLVNRHVIVLRVLLL